MLISDREAPSDLVVSRLERSTDLRHLEFTVLLLNEIQLRAKESNLGVRNVVGRCFDQGNLTELVLDLPANATNPLYLNCVIQSVDV